MAGSSRRSASSIGPGSSTGPANSSESTSSSGSADSIQQAWALMQRFVEAHDRRGAWIPPRRRPRQGPLPAPRRTGDPWPARGGQRRRRPLRDPDRRQVGSSRPGRTPPTPRRQAPQAGRAHGRRERRRRHRRRHLAAPDSGDQKPPGRRPQAAHRAPRPPPRHRHGRTRRSRVGSSSVTGSRSRRGSPGQSVTRPVGVAQPLLRPTTKLDGGW